MKTGLCAVLLMACVFSTPVRAADLTAAQVERFVNVMQELKPLFDKYSDEVGDDGDAASTAQIVRDWAQDLRQNPEAGPALKKYGLDFDGLDSLAQQITPAYMALKLGANGKDILGQMRESLAEIEASTDIPDNYKAQMVAQMRQSMAEMEKSLHTPAAVQAVVRPFVPKLDAIFEWQE